MFSKPSKKQQVKLEDFDFAREIKTRTFLSQLSSFELEVLQEILYQPLIFSLEAFSDHIEAEQEAVKKILIKLAETQLLQMQGGQVVVNKELRKFFEFQVDKFDPNFKPSVNYIIQLLNQVPIGTLLDWYPIPRSSNDIIDSIIEKCLKSPKTFHLHKAEFLSEAPPIFKEILEKLYQDDDLKISAEEIQQELQVSREEFEKIVLILEFNFLCFLSYEKKEGCWKEVLTPFDELKRYFLHYRSFKLSNFSVSEEHDAEEFPLLERLLKELQNVYQGFNDVSQEYMEWMQVLGLLEEEKEQPKLTEAGLKWIEMPLKDQARHFHRKLLLCEELSLLTGDYSIKDFRSLEKSLKRIAHLEWISLDEFIQSLDISLGADDEVCLKKNKGAWEYTIPKYSQETVSWIQKVLCEYYANIGLLTLAEFENQIYISLTDFGRQLFYFE